MNYIDTESREVKEVVRRLISDDLPLDEKLNRLFLYVRDDIEFGFLKEADFLSASEIIQYKKGQCNNKSILFHTLCKAAGIESRIHFSGIHKAIQSGLFKGLAYFLIDDEISHSWVEVKIEDKWYSIDNYINDNKFYKNGKALLKREGKTLGYSIACTSGTSSSELNMYDEKFVQMDAVTTDHGTYDDPNEYFSSNNYKNNPSPLKMWLYRRVIKKVNKRIKEIREAAF